MRNYDWTSNIKTCTSVLHLLGLWPTGDDTYKPGFYMFRAIISLSVFFFGHIFFQIANIYFVRNNLAALTGTIYILLVEIMGVCKVYMLIKNMKMLKKLLRVLDTDMFQPKNPTQIEAIEANVWYWKVWYKSFFSMGVGVDLFWAIYPFVDEGGSETRRLPFLAWYPFNSSESPKYEAAYIHQVCSISFITQVQLNIDALAAAMGVIIGSQLDILSDNVRNLHRLGETIAVIIKQCVEHHKKILKYVKQYNKFLNWIVFVQFFVSAISIGLTMFQLTLATPMSSEFFTLVIYGLAIAVQMFMYCWVGNEIEVKSSKILYAAFECEWLKFPITKKKDLLFFTLRAQKPVKLSALNLFHLSIDTFIKILKTSWSYFALLNQVNSKK